MIGEDGDGSFFSLLFVLFLNFAEAFWGFSGYQGVLNGSKRVLFGWSSGLLRSLPIGLVGV